MTPRPNINLMITQITLLKNLATCFGLILCRTDDITKMLQLGLNFYTFSSTTLREKISLKIASPDVFNWLHYIRRIKLQRVPG
jgi:hypothetical protein